MPEAVYLLTCYSNSAPCVFLGYAQSGYRCYAVKSKRRDVSLAQALSKQATLMKSNKREERIIPGDNVVVNV